MILKKNTKACADNGLTMRDHFLSFHCLKRFVLFHSMEGKLHDGKSMLKDIAFKINLIIFVSFYFVGIALICALRRDSVCKALSYLCHNIMKLSGMEWFAYRSMFVSCEGVWQHRYWTVNPCYYSTGIQLLQ